MHVIRCWFEAWKESGKQCIMREEMQVLRMFVGRRRRGVAFDIAIEIIKYVYNFMYCVTDAAAPPLERLNNNP